ncbi:MAG: hypothetical protein QM535_17155 [Limnohabitans sp.]|nr:hypothetical protein [Limnohabitans sp.]
MSIVQILEIVQENIPNFEGSCKEGLGKARKLLNMLSKVNPSLNINAVENFITLFSNTVQSLFFY